MSEGAFIGSLVLNHLTDARGTFGKSRKWWTSANTRP